MTVAAMPVGLRPAFVMTPAIDLRSGIAAAYVVEPTEETVRGFGPLGAAAVEFARGAAFNGPLQLPMPMEALSVGADGLAVQVQDVGLTPHRFDLVLCERDLENVGYISALDFAESCRARGFGVALRASSRSVVPLSQRARAAFAELQISCADAVGATTRLFAAAEAGLVVTALGAAGRTHAALLRNGFDRVI